jgi:hypothetical protein
MSKRGVFKAFFTRDAEAFAEGFAETSSWKHPPRAFEPLLELPDLQLCNAYVQADPKLSREKGRDVTSHVPFPPCILLANNDVCSGRNYPDLL